MTDRTNTALSKSLLGIVDELAKTLTNVIKDNFGTSLTNINEINEYDEYDEIDEIAEIDEIDKIDDNDNDNSSNEEVYSVRDEKLGYPPDVIKTLEENNIQTISNIFKVINQLFRNNKKNTNIQTQSTIIKLLENCYENNPTQLIKYIGALDTHKNTLITVSLLEI